MKNLSEYLILEGDPLRQLNKEIGEIRRKLMAKYKAKGSQENFGQKELRKLMDKWHYADIQYQSSITAREMVEAINDFANWCETYDGSYVY